MITLLALALAAVAGVALIVGAKDVTAQIVKGVVGGVLVIALIPCFIQSCRCHLARLGGSGLAPAASVLLPLLGLVVLALIGFVAWRRRADRAKARELWARRNGSPRARALPAPPRPPAGDHS
jgi:LPXTG-motif cell wall-anchored protein